VVGTFGLGCRCVLSCEAAAARVGRARAAVARIIEHREHVRRPGVVASEAGAAARHVAREPLERRLGALEVAEHLVAVAGRSPDALDGRLEAARRGSGAEHLRDPLDATRLERRILFTVGLVASPPGHESGALGLVAERVDAVELRLRRLAALASRRLACGIRRSGLNGLGGTEQPRVELAEPRRDAGGRRLRDDEDGEHEEDRHDDRGADLGDEQDERLREHPAEDAAGAREHRHALARLGLAAEEVAES
jgi:hypothetical protein